MSGMTDPMNSLRSFQQGLSHRSIQLQQGYNHKDIYVHADNPNNVPRFTYAILDQGQAQSIALFVLTEPVNGVPCFQLGWATSENYRGRGLASDLVARSLEELKDGMKRNGVSEFYIEAIVSKLNRYSLKLADKIFTEPPSSCKDTYSSEDAFQYLRLIQ